MAPPGLASPRVKRNRRFWGAGLLVALALVIALVLSRGGGAHPAATGQSHGGGAHAQGGPAPKSANPRLDPDWQGDGQPVTFAFGGDVHFPAGTTLGDRLAADPANALGPTVPEAIVNAPPPSEPITAPELTWPLFTAPEASLNCETCPEPIAPEVTAPEARWLTPI